MHISMEKWMYWDTWNNQSDSLRKITAKLYASINLYMAPNKVANNGTSVFMKP